MFLYVFKFIVDVLLNAVFLFYDQSIEKEIQCVNAKIKQLHRFGINTYLLFHFIT